MIQLYIDNEHLMAVYSMAIKIRGVLNRAVLNRGVFSRAVNLIDLEHSTLLLLCQWRSSYASYFPPW